MLKLDILANDQSHNTRLYTAYKPSSVSFFATFVSKSVFVLPNRFGLSSCTKKRMHLEPWAQTGGVKLMHGRYFLILASLIGFMSLWASSSFANTFCYYLENKTNRYGNPPKIILSHICLSRQGDISLYGANSFRYDFHVNAAFHHSTTSCSTNSRTGGRSCHYNPSYINFSGQNARASLNEDVIAEPVTTNHGKLSVFLDDDEYIFSENHPQNYWNQVSPQI